VNGWGQVAWARRVAAGGPGSVAGRECREQWRTSTIGESGRRRIGSSRRLGWKRASWTHSPAT